jgi:hypothetical protein
MNKPPAQQPKPAVVATPEQPIAAPYSNQEIVKLVTSFVSTNVYENSYNQFFSKMRATFDVNRSGAYDKINFGDNLSPNAKGFGNMAYLFGPCAKFFPLFANPDTQSGMENWEWGEDAFNFTILYVIAKSDAEKAANIQQVKDHLNLIAENSGACKDKVQNMAKLKALLSAVIQAGPEILEANKHAQDHVVAAQNAQNLSNQKLAACQNTSPYRVYVYSRNILDMQNMKLHYEGIIQQQKDGAKASGVVDQQVLYDAGNRIASINKQIKDTFAAYKQVGGSASNSDLVKPLASPCSNL